MKQQAAERRRGLAVLNRLESLKEDEKVKVKMGKKPFFLKNAAKKSIALEERFAVSVSPLSSPRSHV